MIYFWVVAETKKDARSMQPRHDSIWQAEDELKAVKLTCSKDAKYRIFRLELKLLGVRRQKGE